MILLIAAVVPEPATLPTRRTGHPTQQAVPAPQDLGAGVPVPQLVREELRVALVRRGLARALLVCSAAMLGAVEALAIDEELLAGIREIAAVSDDEERLRLFDEWAWSLGFGPENGFGVTEPAGPILEKDRAPSTGDSDFSLFGFGPMDTSQLEQAGPKDRAPSTRDRETSLERTECDPSYPTVCIPPPPPDLNCRDLTFSRFEVRGRDPHRLDSDRDGVGCES